MLAQAKDEQRRLEHDLLNKKGRERIADLREEMQKTMEESAGIYRSGASLAKGVERAAAAAGALCRTSRSRIAAGRSTPSASPRWSCRSCSTSPRRSSTSALRREESRGAHQRTDFPKRDDRALPRALADLPQRRRLVSRRVPAGHDHPLAAGRAGLWGGRTAWRTASRCR